MAGKLYRYEAVDQHGEPLTGSMEAVNAESVSQTLSERGLQVNLVEPFAKEEGIPRRATRSLSWEDLSQFNEHLVAITKSGMPLAPSLKAVAHDLKRGRLKSAIAAVGNDLEAGKSLEDTLESNGAHFPSVYRSMIRAGERTGNLPGVLETLARYSTRMLDLKAQLVMTLTYPFLVLVVSVFVVLYLLQEIVPTFAEIFSDFGAALPAPTQLLVNISEVFTNHSGAVLLIAIGGIGLVWLTYVLLKSTRGGQYILDRIFEALPLIGYSYRVGSVSRFARSLGLMLKSDVPILESLDLAAASANNAVLKHHVDAAAIQVAQGETVADAMSDTRYFPHAFCWFLANAESFGSVPETLLTVSESYDQSLSNNDKLVMTLLGPVMVFLIALIVGYIVMALYLPIFTLGDAISG